jgi:glutamate---cysteine ligase / carboxylate-amine ligase
MTDDHGHTSILDGVRERFDSSTDFTIGLEEEYQLLDPVTLELVNRFEDLFGAAEPPFADRLAGELIASEIEFRTTAHESFPSAARELVDGRLTTLALADRLDLALGISGVHPFSRWEQQRIIDTPHYRLVEEDLGYIAWTNNTWSLHLHCGVRGADRAMAVCTAMRSVLPELLALSANSPLFWGRDTRLASTRIQTFVKSFPRCGVPDAFDDWEAYAERVRLLERTNSIIKGTQIWWSIRPHHDFGTIEVRICDGQTEMSDALAVAATALACIARYCADYDEGRRLPRHERGLIDENMWRAQRHGLQGRLIDLDRGEERPTPAAIAELIEASEPTHAALGISGYIAHAAQMLERGNGAMRQRALLHDTGGDVRAVHAHTVARVRASAEEALTTHGLVTTR